jgi:hypothetical protein
MQSQPPPKGSLEDLFRHHLLESEAAAVPPRPLVWEHIDNSLLLAQNEKYRRRLLVHRWGMAASLLLASLAGGGWWHSQQVATATLASATARQEAARRAVAGAVAPSSGTNIGAGVATLAHASALPQGEAGSPAGTSTAGTAAQGFDHTTGFEHAGRTTGRPAASPAAGNDQLAYAGAGTVRGRSWPAVAGRPATAGLAGHAYPTGPAGALAYESAQPGSGTRQGHRAAAAHPSPFSSPNANAIAGTSTSTHTQNAATFALAQPAEAGTQLAQPELVSSESLSAATSADARSGEGLLAGRLATLALAAPAGPPAGLVAKALPPAPTELRRWRYGAEYAISAFQPNIDFNRGGSSYNSALGSNTVSLTRAAAAEYRANLRPGLGQRLTLRATRWLGGHWSVGTGLEVAQQSAYSATSAAFTGEQLADASSFNSSAPIPSTGSNLISTSRGLQGSSFCYRSAGIPIELQYDNQAKAGVSFYGRVGAIVSALLSARSEVAGNPEATRSYSAFSASSPYRRLTALLRGSAGVRYRPAGRGWGVHAGPTAEAGVQSLNSETDHSFLQQQRPYSVGLEAGFEFGGNPRPVPATN